MNTGPDTPRHDFIIRVGNKSFKCKARHPLEALQLVLIHGHLPMLDVQRRIIIDQVS